LLLRKIITEEEYRPKKNAILEKKAQLFRKMKKLEEEANSRFEPITEFVKGQTGHKSGFETESQARSATREFFREPKVAEREGFEPSVPVYPVQRFSKPYLTLRDNDIKTH